MRGQKYVEGIEFFCRGDLSISGAEDNLLDQLCGYVNSNISAHFAEVCNNEFQSGKIFLENDLSFDYDLFLSDEEEWVIHAYLT